MLYSELLLIYELEIFLRKTELWKCITELEINIVFVKQVQAFL